VFIAISSSQGVTVYSENFKGSRNQVRMLCLDRAIQILREHLA
jgi:nicotinamide mononucleotide (NMN) deamidase PncC